MERRLAKHIQENICYGLSQESRGKVGDGPGK